MAKYNGEKKGEPGKQKQKSESSVGNQQGTTQTGAANQGGQEFNQKQNNNTSRQADQDDRRK